MIAPITSCCFVLLAFLSPRQICVWAATGTETSMLGKNANKYHRIHRSHMFHTEPRAIINSVISDVRRRSLSKNTRETSFLDIDVSSNNLDDSAAVSLMRELVSLLESNADEADAESETNASPPLSIKLALAMNKLTPSGASGLFEAMKSGAEIAPQNERDDVAESESRSVLENSSLESSTGDVRALNNETVDADDTNNTSSNGRTSTDASQHVPEFLIEELDLSFNNIGGHGAHPPDTKLLDSAMRLFEGDGVTFAPRILSLENCGIGPAFCRQIGRGILNAFERKHNGARDVRLRPSALRLGGNRAIGDAGTVALAAALRLAIENDRDSTGVLNELDLSSCNVGDVGAEALALALAFNPGCLNRLNLSNNKITNAGSKALAAALVDASCRSGAVLEQIILDNNVDISDDGAAALAAALSAGAVKSISMRSCSIKAEGTAAFGKALMSLSRKHCNEPSQFHIDLSGNHFGTRKIKKRKGAASLIRDRASTNIKVFGKTLTSAVKKIGSETMGLTADSDDDEELMGSLLEEEEEEFFGKNMQSCGGRALADEILSSEEQSKEKKGTHSLKISIGMRQCCLDDDAIDALSASIVGAKNLDLSVDVSMNQMEGSVEEALKFPEKDPNLLNSMAQRHMNFLDRIADARQRQLEAAAKMEEVDRTFFDDDNGVYDGTDSSDDGFIG